MIADKKKIIQTRDSDRKLTGKGDRKALMKNYMDNANAGGVRHCNRKSIPIWFWSRIESENQFGEHALSDTSIIGPFVWLRFVVSRVVGAI
jgi:hypothetical protein